MDDIALVIALGVLSFLAVARHIWLGDLERRVAKMEREKQLAELLISCSRGEAGGEQND